MKTEFIEVHKTVDDSQCEHKYKRKDMRMFVQRDCIALFYTDPNRYYGTILETKDGRKMVVDENAEEILKLLEDEEEEENEEEKTEEKHEER